jgi:hypothetical protein
VAHQVLVLVGLLVTYGIAAVAALGAEKAIRPSGFMWPSLLRPGFCDHSGRTPAQRHLPVAWQRWTLPGMLWHTENQRPDPGRGMNAESRLFLKSKYIYRALRELGQSYPATRGLPKNTQTCESHGKP